MVVLSEIVVLNHMLEILPCLLAVLCILVLFSAARFQRSRGNEALVLPLLMLMGGTAVFVLCQVLWMFFMATDSAVFQMAFALVRTLNAILFFVSLIALGRVLANRD